MHIDVCMTSLLHYLSKKHSTSGHRLPQFLYICSESLLWIIGNMREFLWAAMGWKFEGWQVSEVYLCFADHVIDFRRWPPACPWAVCSWVWSGWMRISSYMSEAMVLSQKTEVCPLWVGNESLPQVEGFKYLGIPFTSERRVEWQIDKQLGVEGAVMWTLHQCVVEKRDMSMKVKLS